MEEKDASVAGESNAKLGVCPVRQGKPHKIIMKKAFIAGTKKEVLYPFCEFCHTPQGGKV